MELAQPAATKGGMSTRSKIAIGIGLPVATAIGGFALGRRFNRKQSKRRQYST